MARWSARAGYPRLRVDQLEDRSVPALVAAYGFNEGSGSTAGDASGLGNTGTISGATWVAEGRNGGALSFDGVNDWVTVADSASLDLTTGMTLEAWVRPTAINGWETVVLKEAAGELAYALYADNNGETGGARRPGAWVHQGGTSYSTLGTAQLGVNAWTHLAATYDGSALRMYVNGSLASTLNQTGAIDATTGTLRMGGNSVWSEWFNGLIDDVRIYNHALTAAEIQDDMSRGVADTTPPTVTAVTPAAGATGVAPGANVTAAFSEDVVPSSVTGGGFELRDAGGALVPAAVTYSAATRTATLDPTAALTPAATYTALVRGGVVQDPAGNALAADFSWSFTTAPVSVAVSDATVVEGNGGPAELVFTVSLNAPSAQEVTVSYATADGTSTAGIDYTALPPTVLTFALGETSKSVSVPVLGDTLGETNETVLLNLSAPTNAVLADAQGVGTIVEDDGTFIGSDAFGYSAYTHPFEAVDLVPGAAGVFTIRTTGNNNSDLVTLSGGATVNFYGTSYTSFYVSTNGLITFGAANTSAANANLTSSPAQRALAPLWDDWVNVSGQAMLLGRYEDPDGNGVADRLVLEWNNVQGNVTTPSPVTFQAILQLNTGTTPGHVTFNYVDLDAGAGNAYSNAAGATVGFKDTGTQGTRRLLVSFNSTATGYVGSGKAIRVVPDTTPPTVDLTGPAAGATVNGTATVTAAAADNIAVAGVQFLVDGIPLGAEDTIAPYSATWDTTAAAAGTHMLAARARDTSGNLTTTAARAVTVVPKLTITAPANNATVGGPTVTVNYTTAGDLAGANVDHVHFTIDGTTTVMDLTIDGTYQLSNLAPGPHTLTGVLVRANHTNIVGTETAPISFTVTAPDTTPPTVALTGPAGGATVTGSVALTATASDNVGVVGVQFLVDGSAVGAEDTTAPYGTSWDSSGAAAGLHTLTARARDAAGNVTVSDPVAVTVTNPNDPAVIGQWSSTMNWPLVAINTVLLKDGRVLMWDGGPSCIGSTSARVWNPVTNAFTPVPIPYFVRQDDDIFCSGQALLADGRVLVVGGHDCDGPELGIRMVNIFDPATLTWTRGPDMAYRRWYPTATTLKDGRVLVTAGSVNGTNDYVPIPEIYDPVTNSWTTLTAASRTIANYPFVFQSPDGRVLVAGSDEAAMATYELDVETQTWTTVDSRVLDAHSAVMYRPGEVMKSGSSYYSWTTQFDNDPAAPTTYVLDMNAATPAWQQTASMTYPRAFHNLTVLADGTVLATGGDRTLGGFSSAQAVYQAEVWSPVTRTWTTLASMQSPRLYHSTALLLPDGRVLSAGGGRNYINNNDHLTADVFSPPYLFKGPRPTVTSAPGTLAYRAEFFVATPDAAAISAISLVRNGSVTHSVNMDQRFVPLAFRVVSGGLMVTAPVDGTIAPPGHYMLFLVSGNGVPSVAPIVRLPAPYEDAQPPTSPTGLTATPASEVSVGLSWTAATDNVGVTGYTVHRSTASGFVPSAANQIGQTTGITFTDVGLAPGTFYYRVVAEDAAGNTSLPSNEATATVVGDTTPPSVNLTAPAPGATVSGTVAVTANASDNVGVFGVQFKLDGLNLGGEDTTTPYAVNWTTSGVPNGIHTLTAVARDAAGNQTTASQVTVTVNNVTPSGLVGAWGFEEGTGTTTNDLSGNTLHGILTNATWTTGKYGNGLSLNGTNSLVTVADHNLLDLTDGLTVEAWVRPTAAAADFTTVVLKERGTTDLSYGLYAADGANRPPSGYVRVGTADRAVVGTAGLALNAWTHLATSYDGVTQRLFVNGVQAASRAQTGAVTTSANPLRFGGNNVWGEWFNGLIDEVRIYNRALSATEIQADMNAPVGGGSGGQLADRPAADQARTADVLTDEQVAPVVSAALDQWAAAGLPVNLLPNLDTFRVIVADLPGISLGFTDVTTRQIWLDETGAGYGWVPAAGGFDLETVVTHEIGHLLGIPDLRLYPSRPVDLMDQALAPCEVRRPSELDIRLALAAADGLISPTAMMTVPVDVEPLAFEEAVAVLGVTITVLDMFVTRPGPVARIERRSDDADPTAVETTWPALIDPVASGQLSALVGWSDDRFEKEWWTAEPLLPDEE